MKPPCSWDGCSSRAAKAWPVCRSHLRAWLVTQPVLSAIEHVDVQRADTATERRMESWAGDVARQRLAGRSEPRWWLVVGVVAYGSRSRHPIDLICEEADAYVLADRLEGLGRKSEAERVRQAVFGVMGEQIGLFGDQLGLFGSHLAGP